MQAIKNSVNMATTDCLGEWHATFEAVVPHIHSKMGVEAFEKLCNANPEYQLRFASLFSIVHTAIQAAIESSNLPLSRYIIARLDADVLNQQNALMNAVQMRSVGRVFFDKEDAKIAIKIIRMLVCKGVNVNLLWNTARGLWSPLTFACEGEDVALATLLLGYGAKKSCVVTGRGEWQFSSFTHSDIADKLDRGIIQLSESYSVKGEATHTKAKMLLERKFSFFIAMIQANSTCRILPKETYCKILNLLDRLTFSNALQKCS